MAAVWYRAKWEARARWRAWLAMAVLVGLASGAAIAAAAGARRTESAYPRFLRAQRAMDVLSDVRSAETGAAVDVSVVKRFPMVADAASLVALFNSEAITASGRRISFPDAFPIVALDDRFGRDLNRRKILVGRDADQARIDETVVGFGVAERFGIRLGETLEIRIIEFDPMTFIPTGKVMHSHRVTVVGIGAMPGEFQPLAGAAVPTIQLTRAYFDATDQSDAPLPPDQAFAIRFRNGIEDLAAFEKDAGDRGLAVNAFFRQPTQTETVRRSARFQSVALWLLAALTGLATIAVLGQALSRHATLEADEYPALGALGMSRAQLVAVGLIRSVIIGGGAVLIAAAIAVVASPLAPTGLMRIAEVSPGFSGDLTALGIGGGAIIALVVVASTLSHARASRGGFSSSLASMPLRPSRTAEALARAGASPAAVSGVRLALVSGKGRSSVPVRSTVMSVSLGVLAVVSAFTFGASMDHLVDSPGLSGWTFDLALGGPPDVVAEARAGLEGDGAIAEFTVGAIAGVTIGGRVINDAGLAFPPGPIGPAIADGRAPADDDEVALGRETMEVLGVGIGDRTELAVLDEGEGGPEPGAPRTFTIVGRLIQPSLGFNLGSAGEGASITLPGFHLLAEGIDDAEVAAFVRLRPGIDVREVTERLGPRYPSVFTSARRETSAVSDVGRLAGIPFLLAGILGAMAAATMAHTLLTSIRRRARDLAILRTIGFVGGQVRAAVAWQATTLVVAALVMGVPLGIVIGRWGWLAFADTLGVVPVATAPVLALALVVPAVLALANLVGLLPARAAARTQPAIVLRTE